VAEARKRYIAGAVCPACGAVDKIYVIDAGGEKSRHCKACDFSEGPRDDLPEDRQPVNVRDS